MEATRCRRAKAKARASLMAHVTAAESMGIHKDVVQKDVARFLVGRIASGHPALQQDMAFHPHPAGRRRRLADVVGLHRPLGDQHVRLFLHRLADQKFQLAGLVAARGQAGAVVALDEQPRAAEQFAQPGHGLDRRRLVAQMRSRKAVEVQSGGLTRQGLGVGHGES